MPRNRSLCRQLVASIILCALACLSAASAPSLSWVRLGGPPGGTGYDIRYNFANFDTWYVTDAGAGVHISTDNGLTWKESNVGIPGQAGSTGDGIPIFCLTVDPHNPQIVWCGTDKTGHIYKSIDAGLTWVQRDQGVRIEYDTLTFRGFTVDPRSSDIVYAMGELTSEALGGPRTWKGGTGGVVYRTLDGGESWQEIWNGGMPSSLARYLWIDPRNPDVLYVSTGIFDRGAVGDGESPDDPFGGLGVLKSTDGGKTWRILGKENGLRNLYIGSLFMHPEDPDVLLAAAGHVIEPDTLPFIEQMMMQDQPGPMGIFRTSDGGETWVQTLASYEVFTAVEMSPSNPNIVYAASDESVHRSVDGGETWTQVAGGGWGPPGIATGFPIDVQCDPRNPDRIFINNYGGGNFLSEDGGRTWVNASQGYTGEDSFDVAVDPYDPALVYAAGFGGLWRSTDGGTTWEGITNARKGRRIGHDVVSADPTQSGHILAGRENLVESWDGGSKWTFAWEAETFLELGVLEEAMRGISPSGIAFAPSDPNRVYVGYGDENCAVGHEPSCDRIGPGLLVSYNGGSTWQRAVDDDLDELSIFSVAVDASDADVVYAGTGIGLYTTTDGGHDWTPVTALPKGRPVHAVAVDPNDSNRILAGLEQNGMYRSTDGGASWRRMSAGLEPNSALHDIVFDPTNTDVVYASDQSSGVYRSVDGGMTWTQINEGLRNRAAMGLALSSDGDHLYLAVRGDGIYRLDLSGEAPKGAE